MPITSNSWSYSDSYGSTQRDGNWFVNPNIQLNTAIENITTQILASTGYGTIMLPNKTMAITRPIILKDNITLCAIEPPGPIIYAAADYTGSMIWMSGSNTQVRNIYLYQDPNSSGGCTGIRIGHYISGSAGVAGQNGGAGSNYHKVDNCKIQLLGYTSTGISLEQCWIGEILNTKIAGCDKGIHFKNGHVNAFQIRGGTAGSNNTGSWVGGINGYVQSTNIFDGFTFEQNLYCGLYIGGEADGTQMINCHCEYNRQADVMVDSKYAAGTQIHGNWMGYTTPQIVIKAGLDTYSHHNHLMSTRSYEIYSDAFGTHYGPDIRRSWSALNPSAPYDFDTRLTSAYDAGSASVYTAP